MSFFSELSPELSQQSPKELMDWFADSAPNGKECDPDHELLLEEVAVHLAQTGSAGFDFLLSQLAGADEPHGLAILVGLSYTDEKLSSKKRAKVEESVRACLDDNRPLIVARAIDTLRHLGCKVARKDVLKFRKHKSPYVVGSLLRFMAAHFPQDAISLLEEALDSPEPIVRENAVDELDELGHRPALAKIKRLLKDESKDVRQAARTAVKHLESRD
jgi:HEAT repeats